MRQYSLLLVDDLETNLTILGNLFKKEGYKLFKAADGDEALKVARSSMPDLILLDVMMPKKDGFQVCKELKADPNTAHIPIIFLTGRDDKEDKISGFDLGAVDYIIKPFDFKEVRARVHSQLLIKQMSDELKEERDKLASTNEFIQLILNSIPTSICVLDKEKDILTFNETFGQVFHILKNNLIGVKFLDLLNGKIPILDKKIQFADIGDLHTIEKILDEDIEIKSTECRISIENDEKTFLFHSHKLIEDQYLIDLVDITDRKKMENELVQQSRLRYIGEVVIGVAHEINNPNTFIRVNNKNIELLLNHFKPIIETIRQEHSDFKIGNFSVEEAFSRLERAREGIYQASERILMVIERLKNFAKKDSLVMEKLEIKDIVSDALGLTSYFSEKLLDIVTNLEEDLPSVSGTQIELTQLLVNLITNSYHAIEEKIVKSDGSFTHGKIIVDITCDKTTNEIVILISDNGTGIPKNIQDKIFNPFFTTKPQGIGSGLGLSLCYGIIRRHKGDISYSSIPGEKTEFVIRLPIQK
jgi:signal transduction histidine kinase/CheY-like chemotaxis protein